MGCYYELSRLDAANVRRSLGGAVRRSGRGRLLLMITTKSGTMLPDGFSQHKIKSDNSCFFEADTDGHVSADGRIRVFLTHEDDFNIETEATIRLGAIERPIWVEKPI